MPQSLSALYIHIIFSTKDRYPFFQNEDVKNETFKYIAVIIKEKNSFPILINGTKDHIHILCNISKKISVSELVGEIKRSSSKWLKTKDGIFSKFYWQKGYGAFSVSESNKKNTLQYIQEQVKHHRKKTYQEELREILNKYKINYDERYIWD